MTPPFAPKEGTPQKQTKKRFQELAQCPDCGTTLSNTMSRCPSCGRMMVAWWKWVLGTFLWMLAGLVALVVVFRSQL